MSTSLAKTSGAALLQQASMVVASACALQPELSLKSWSREIAHTVTSTQPAPDMMSLSRGTLENEGHDRDVVRARGGLLAEFLAHVKG